MENFLQAKPSQQGGSIRSLGFLQDGDRELGCVVVASSSFPGKPRRRLKCSRVPGKDPRLQGQGSKEERGPCELLPKGGSLRPASELWQQKSVSDKLGSCGESYGD